MQSLSRDIYLAILDYVDYFDQMACTSCCKYLYRSFMNPYVRRITLKLSQVYHHNPTTSESYWTESFMKLINSIEDEQSYYLRLKAEAEPLSVDVLLALTNLPKALTELECTVPQLCQFANSTMQLSAVKKLAIVYFAVQARTSFDRDYDLIATSLLTQFAALRSLCVNMNTSSLMIPYLPSLLHLEVSRNYYTSPIPVEYRHQLLSLKLSNCRITDVSMLGEIPRLDLENCHELEDISALTHNQQSIRIAYCSKVREVCQVFLLTRSIELEDLHPAAKIDMTSWQRVQTLKLTEAEDTKIELIGTASIPLTVRDCSLGGKYIELVDLRITEQHCLRILRLSGSNTLCSLADLGFERLVFFELDDLSRLSSLEGIGANCQRVAISYCHILQDLSPLRNVKDVSLVSCAGLSLAEQLPLLEQVRSLQLGVEFFYPRLLSCLPHPIETLDLSLTLSIACFEGLETIPHLILSYSHLKSVLFEYVVNGGKLNNQRIELVGCIYSKFVVYYLSIYELYLKEDYMMFWKPSKRVDIGNVSFLRRQ